ncbi:hypothetical protein CF319_g6342 [Tilletia indica]|nr:hypothetical protein CF319_g6342 [Tilletia indica]
MYAPMAAAAAVAANGHRQTYPTLPRPMRIDEIMRRSSNLPGQDPYYPHLPPPPPPALQSSLHGQQQQAVAAQQMRQQVPVQHPGHGGHYWAPPLAPRLTAAAPRAAWPQELGGGAARVDAWGRYALPPPAAMGPAGQWGVGVQQPANAFPSYAQPHQQLEHQLLLHHYLSKLQTPHDHPSRHQAEVYQQQQHQAQRYQQQYYGAPHAPSEYQPQPQHHHPQQQQQPSGSSRQWPAYMQSQPSRQPALAPPEQTVASHDWHTSAAPQQPARPSYAADWRSGNGPSWGPNEWAAGQRAHAAQQMYPEDHARSAYAGQTWSQTGGSGMYENRDRALGGWERQEATAEHGYGYDYDQDAHLAVPNTRPDLMPPRDHYASEEWHHHERGARQVPTFAVVSPAPPPSPTGVAHGGEGKTGNNGSGPAPPSPATLDKSSVPIYEIGVEIVSAVCKSLLGSVVRSGDSSSSAMADSGVLSSPSSTQHEDDARAGHRSRHGSQSRQRSMSRPIGGLGVYDGTNGCTDALAHQFGADDFDVSDEPATQANNSVDSSMVSSSQLTSLLLQGSTSAEAISSEDGSEGSSEPGTPASSISDTDEFYPKPMSLMASESAPSHLRSAVNFSLDQSGIWEPKKQAAAGWASSSPPMPSHFKKARKSESHSQRPAGLDQTFALNKTMSYSSAKTATQDSAFDEGDQPSSGSGLLADGPLNLMSPSWPWTTVADDFYSMPICHGRSHPFNVFTMAEDAFVFRSQVEATGTSSPMLNMDIKTAFARFAHQVLSQTLLSPTAFMLGLLYILRVPSLVLSSDGTVKDEAKALFAEPPSAAPFKLFTLGMMMANKQLDDNTFTNRTWQEVTGIPLLDLNRLERFYLERCHFEISVPPEVWYAFLGRLQDREVERRTQSARAHLQSPTSMANTIASGFDSIVSSECSRRTSAILKTLLNGEESISPILGSVGEPALALMDQMMESPPSRAAAATALDSESSLTYLADREYSGRHDDPRYSAPAYHPEADVFDDDSGPFRQRAYRPRSAAAIPGGPGSFEPISYDVPRSQSDPAAVGA